MTLGEFESGCEKLRPRVLLVLGSGMGDALVSVPATMILPFAEIPGLPSASVPGHKGRFSLRWWCDQTVLVSEGRLHYYEGNPWEVVVRPIQIAARLGIKTAILTNAAGGIRDDLGPGSLMPIVAHLEWNRPYPWREPARPSPYSKRLLDLIRPEDGLQSAGVYASVTGPSYETPAEIRALRSQGVDAVGMSTSREAIAGHEAGMEVAAFSLITNRAAGLSSETLDHEEVMIRGKEAGPRMAQAIESLLKRL